MRVVFVGGIHGVGKSTLCERLASSRNVLHVKASSLIRDANRSAAASPEKLVEDVAANQAILVARFQEVLTACTAQAILIDGHFTLGKPDEMIEHVSADVFAALRVSSIVCLEDAPSAIAARLQARDGSAPSEAYLSMFQSAELEQAADVSKALGVRLTVINAFEANAVQLVLAHL